jgi:hypothetical protein
VTKTGRVKGRRGPSESNLSPAADERFIQCSAYFHITWEFWQQGFDDDANGTEQQSKRESFDPFAATLVRNPTAKECECNSGENVDGDVRTHARNDTRPEGATIIASCSGSRSARRR